MDALSPDRYDSDDDWFPRSYTLNERSILYHHLYYSKYGMSIHNHS